MNKQHIFNDLFALWFSGAAEMKNDKEIAMPLNPNLKVKPLTTVEFIDYSPNHVITRQYCIKTGRLIWENNVVGGKRNGKCVEYHTSGKFVSEYKDGIRHGRVECIDSIGMVYGWYVYDNGKLIDASNKELLHDRPEST